MQRIISLISTQKALVKQKTVKKIGPLTALGFVFIILPAINTPIALASSLATTVANINPNISKPDLPFKPMLAAVSASEKSVVIINQKLGSLLAEFAQRQGLALKMTKKLRTRVKSKVLPGEPVQFLQKLAKLYPIDWYQMGNDLFVSKKKERVTRLLNIGSISPKQLKADIERTVINANSFSYSPIAGSRTIILSGPPTYVAFVELMVKTKLLSGQHNGNIHIYKGGFEISTMNKQ